MKPENDMQTFVIKYKHNPTPVKRTVKATSRVDPRVLRAKRLLDQIETETAKAEELEQEYRDHPMQEVVANAQFDLDWECRELEAASKSADCYRMLAMCKSLQVVQAEALIAQLQKAVDESRKDLDETWLKVQDVEVGMTDRINQSNQPGGRAFALKRAKKELSAQTHKHRKTARETRRRADKLQERLDKLMLEIEPLLIGDESCNSKV